MPPEAVRVTLGGVLGDALRASRRGRLFNFITGPDSPAVRLFDREVAAVNCEGDWYGEHAGKWLVAAARAAAASGDTVLRDRVHAVADHLVAQQEPSGYLGTYAPGRRFMVKQPPKPPSWDGAPSVRTWDIWTHSYLVLGLLEAHRQCSPGHARWLQAACAIGDLCCRTLAGAGGQPGAGPAAAAASHTGGEPVVVPCTQTGVACDGAGAGPVGVNAADGAAGETAIDITDLGNHHGLSATVLMDPAVELYIATGAERYRDLAMLVLAQANRHPPLALLPRALAGVDAFDIATGKAYQLAWNLVALTKLHRVTGQPALRGAVDALWRSIAEHHLTLGGGPWGGAGLRSREVFNPPGVFDPHGYVETCSTLAWIQLNRALLALAAEAEADDAGGADGHGAVACRHADAIEQSAYNDLLGALAPNGEDWCYYVFPNGRRIHTTHWRCCKSSGAMALEELPAIACTQPRPGVVDINLYGPGSASLALPDGTALELEQATAYPFDGDIALRVQPARAVRFVLRLRCPGWASGATLQVGGVAQPPPRPGRYVRIDRTWAPGDWVTLQLPLVPRLHTRINQNTQESRAPDGAAVRQQVLHQAYVAVTRGPLVYATTLVDGYKTAETVRLPGGAVDDWLTVLPAPPRAIGTAASGDGSATVAAESDPHAGPGPAIRLALRDRAPLNFTPYYRTGGRVSGAWRLTWLQLAPTEDIP